MKKKENDTATEEDEFNVSLAKMEEEIKRLTNVHTTERKAARAFLDQTKFDIFNYVKYTIGKNLKLPKHTPTC